MRTQVLTHSRVIFRVRSLVPNGFGCVGSTFCILPTVASIVAVVDGADCNHTGWEPTILCFMTYFMVVDIPREISADTFNVFLILAVPTYSLLAALLCSMA